MTLKRFEKFYIKKAIFDENSLCLELRYSFDDEVHFSEKLYFKDDNFKPRDNLDAGILDDIIFNLSIAFSISYYKAFPTKEIVIESGNLSEDQKAFFHKFFIN